MPPLSADRWARLVLWDAVISGWMRSKKPFPSARPTSKKEIGFQSMGRPERFSAVMQGRYGRTALIMQVSPYGLSLSALFLIAYFIKRERSRRRVAEWEREDSGAR